MASTVWTDKHQAFCYQQKLPPSAQALWQWLLMHQKPDKPDIEFNLQAFNKHVTKSRGRPYDPKTLKRAAAALVESGAIIDEGSERFQWNWKRWILRSIKLLVDKIRPRKKCPRVDTNAEKQASNQQSVSNHQKQQQQSKLFDLCSQAGIYYRPGAEVFDYSIEEVQNAIAHFQRRGGHEKIDNPQGWLIDCLRGEWWIDSLVTTDEAAKVQLFNVFLDLWKQDSS